MIIYIYPLPVEPPSPPPFHPSGSSQSDRLSSLCYIATSHWLSISHVVVHICQCCLLNCPTLSFPTVSISVFSTSLHLHSFSENRFISTIFLDSTYDYWISCNEMGKARACYTEWIESEREKQISYNKAICLVHGWRLPSWLLLTDGQTAGIGNALSLLSVCVVSLSAEDCGKNQSCHNSSL